MAKGDQRSFAGVGGVHDHRVSADRSRVASSVQLTAVPAEHTSIPLLDSCMCRHLDADHVGGHAHRVLVCCHGSNVHLNCSCMRFDHATSC